jgi:hypothetical protein
MGVSFFHFSEGDYVVSMDRKCVFWFLGPKCHVQGGRHNFIRVLTRY